MLSRYLPAVLLVIFLSPLAEGQRKAGSSKKPHRAEKVFTSELSRYSVGFQAGLTQFYGELDDQDMKGILGVGVSRNFNRHLALGFHFTAGKLGGEKEAFFNSYFLNEYNTLELLAKWSLSEQFRKKRKKPGPLDVSIYGGLGLIFFNSSAFDLTTHELVRFTNSAKSARNPLFLRWGQPKGPTGIRNTREGILPVGLSVSHQLLEQWRLGLDLRLYFVRTDKADATSGQRLINPEESASYSDTPNDKFSLISFSIVYRPGGGKN